LITVRDIKESLSHLFFPQLCAACGTDLINSQTELCFDCLASLPETGFAEMANNPVEILFTGRLNITRGFAHYYFTKDSLIQTALHQLKYQRNRDLGIQFGRIMGSAIIRSTGFKPDLLVPLPLFAGREKKRGYNQSALLCRGICQITGIPVDEKVISRPLHTDTQTNKGRIERWKNMEGRFLLKEPAKLTGKHVLLVDDVITTGATLEACGAELIKAGCELSVAALCIAMK
jgi:ComF family protein